MPASSLRIFLPDGEPQGLRVVRKSHWTGLATVCPRELYPAASKRPEFAKTGVYILVGTSETDPERSKVYVGEGDEIHARISKHEKDKEFWTHVIAFTKTDDTLNKADVRQLEARLVALATAAGRAEVDNTQMPNPPLPAEHDLADVESFLVDIRTILPLVGVDLFEPLPPAPAPPTTAPLLTMSLQGVDGKGRSLGGDFVLYQGSTGRVEETQTLTAGYRRLRQRLVEEGVLKQDGASYVVTTDRVFPSPTQAAVVLYGGQISGPQSWKTDEGVTLKALLEAEATAS